MSSDIPKARSLLKTALQTGQMSSDIKKYVHAALKLMTRASPVRHVAGKHQYIDNALKRRIRKLARTGLTEHEIANAVGLRNNGRVSEVLNRKR